MTLHKKNKITSSSKEESQDVSLFALLKLK